LEGLALVDVSAVFRWLSTVEWTEPVKEAVVSAMPSLLEEYGAGRVMSAIEQALPNMPANAAAALLKFSEEEGLSIARPMNREIENASDRSGAAIASIDTSNLRSSRQATISEGITIKELARKFNVHPKVPRKVLLDRGIFAGLNQPLDLSAAQSVVDAISELEKAGIGTDEGAHEVAKSPRKGTLKPGESRIGSLSREQRSAREPVALREESVSRFDTFPVEGGMPLPSVRSVRVKKHVRRVSVRELGNSRVSKGLKELMWHLDGLGQGTLLDLGPAWQTTLNFFLQRGFRASSEDILRGWADFYAEDEARIRAERTLENYEERLPDFLGFTHICTRSRKGKFTVHVRTMKKRLRRGLQAIAEWCQENRHLPVEEQQKTLNAKLRGHYQYYGRPTNYRSIWRFWREVRHIWRKWLNRRTRGNRMTWEKYAAILRKHPLLLPRILHPWRSAESHA
jgi:hypothetical protein